MLGPDEHASPDLAGEMRRHAEEPFPASVTTGEDYSEVNSVLVGADSLSEAARATMDLIGAGRHTG